MTQERLKVIELLEEQIKDTKEKLFALKVNLACAKKCNASYLTNKYAYDLLNPNG